MSSVNGGTFFPVDRDGSMVFITPQGEDGKQLKICTLLKSVIQRLVSTFAQSTASKHTKWPMSNIVLIANFDFLRKKVGDCIIYRAHYGAIDTHDG